MHATDTRSICTVTSSCCDASSLAPAASGTIPRPSMATRAIRPGGRTERHYNERCGKRATPNWPTSCSCVVGYQQSDRQEMSVFTVAAAWIAGDTKANHWSGKGKAVPMLKLSTTLSTGMGKWGIAPSIISLGKGWRLAVSFNTWRLQAQGNTFRTIWIGSCVGPIAGLKVEAKRTISGSVGNRALIHQARSQHWVPTVTSYRPVRSSLISDDTFI
jgi:hypothetical protein